MQRRSFILATLASPAAAWAHHGWSSFDQDRPIYLEGKVVKSKWQNPHAELVLALTNGIKLPTDLAQRSVPAQTAPVDAQGVLTKAILPVRKDKQWEIELAPLSRLEAWKVNEIKVGATLSVVGFTFKEEKGDAILRAEYLFVDGKAYSLRSGPA